MLKCVVKQFIFTQTDGARRGLVSLSYADLSRHSRTFRCKKYAMRRQAFQLLVELASIDKILPSKTMHVVSILFPQPSLPLGFLQSRREIGCLVFREAVPLELS